MTMAVVYFSTLLYHGGRQWLHQTSVPSRQVYLYRTNCHEHGDFAHTERTAVDVAARLYISPALHYTCPSRRSTGNFKYFLDLRVFWAQLSRDLCNSIMNGTTEKSEVKIRSPNLFVHRVVFNNYLLLEDVISLCLFVSLGTFSHGQQFMFIVLKWWFPWNKHSLNVFTCTRMQIKLWCG